MSMRVSVIVTIVAMALGITLLAKTEVQSASQFGAPAAVAASSGDQLLLLVKKKKGGGGGDGGIIKSTCKVCSSKLRFCVIQFKCAAGTEKICQPTPSGDQTCCCRAA